MTRHLQPGRATLVFDGDCGICTTAAVWARRHLPDSVIVAPWQHLDVGGLGLTGAEVTTALYWVDEAGHASRGHLAVGRMLRGFGGAWRLPGRLCSVPPTSWIADRAYRLIARNRYRLPGATPACAVTPGPGEGSPPSAGPTPRADPPGST